MEALSFDDGEYYSKSLDEFRKKTDQIRMDKKMLSLHLPNAVRTILHSQHQIPHQFNVLSIGCGDGEFDRYIVSIIKEELERDEKYKNTKILNCAIDPNTYFVSQYKANIEKPDKDDQTIYKVTNKTFEEYKQERMLKKGSDSEGEIKFHIVHFIHSIYYVDMEETLIYCFENLLQDKGQVICIVQGRDLMSSVLSHCSPVLQGGKPALDESFADKLKKIAQKRAWEVYVRMQEHFTDVTEILDEKSRDGNLLLDYMTQTKNFRTTAESKKVEYILHVIKESSQVMQNGKRLGKRSDGIMFIYK